MPACTSRHLGLLLVLACGLHSMASATDLLETFRRAQSRDDLYLGALANYEASKELIPQARANLLPNASFSAMSMNNRLDKNDGNGPLPVQNFSGNSRTLSVRQALIRPVAQLQLEQAQRQFLAALHDLQRSQNELVLRVATAYMDALYAQEQLKAAQTQVEQFQTQLRAARQAFAQGYGTRVEVDETEARLEQALAEVRQLQSSRGFALEQLAVYADVNDPSPLLPIPAALKAMHGMPGLSHLIEQATESNPEVNLSRMKLEVAQQEVRKSWAAHLPTLDVVAQVTDSRSDNIQFPSVSYVNRQIGLQFNLPLSSGGAAQSSVRQAVAQAQREEHLLNATLSNTRLQLTREYNNLVDGQIRIKAHLSAKRAAEQTLLATEKNLQAGYRTRLDVLNAIQRVAMAEKDLQLAYYQTLQAWLKLQLYSGMPAEQALAQLKAE